MQGHRRKCFCAFCRSERIIYAKKRIGFLTAFGCLLASLSIMFLLFQEFDPRFIVFFVLFLAVAEVFTQIRWRLSVVCKYCGFDPVLYLKDTALALEKVKAKLEQRQKNPETWLARPLNLSKISRAKIEFIQRAQEESVKVPSRGTKNGSGKLLNRAL